jgi:hypothetical protein
MSAWSAGARSIEALAGNGWFEFTVPIGAIGVACGLNDVDVDTSVGDIDHAFLIDSGGYRVVERGTTRTARASYTPGSVFRLVRYNGVVYYCVGSTAELHATLPFKLPGHLVYTSNLFSAGSVYLDAALYAPDDSVEDAALVNLEDIPVEGRAAMAFPPMQVSAEAAPLLATANITFERMTLTAGGSFATAVALSFEPLVCFSGNAGAACQVVMEPMTVDATDSDIAPVVTSVNLFMQPPIVQASGRVTYPSEAHLSFEPMGCISSVGSYSTVRMEFKTPLVFAMGFQTPMGASFNITLPSMIGISAANYLSETAIITSSAQYRVFSDFRETAVLNDRATNIVTVKRDLREKAKLADRDYASAKSTHTEREVAVLNDRTTLYNYRTDVRETAPVISEATATSIARLDVRETFKGRDRIDTASIYTTREVAVLNDSVTLRTRTVHDVRDVAVLNDGTDDVVSGVQTVRETAVLNDSATNISTTRVVVRERGFISDAVTLISLGEVWTANVKTWAMSRYENFPLRDFNDTYALGEDGIFAPSGLYANGHFTTGVTRLGASMKKTVSNLYFYGERETELEVEVTADVRGQRQTYSYTQMARSADDSRMVRCDLGKGFSSTNYQFTVSGSGAFTVEHIEPVIQAGSRRI